MMGQSEGGEIEFDKDVLWDMSYVVFWANNGRERFLCKVDRDAMAELAKIAHSPRNEIKKRRRELKSKLEVIVREKIEQRDLSSVNPPTLTILMEDAKRV